MKVPGRNGTKGVTRALAAVRSALPTGRPIRAGTGQKISAPAKNATAAIIHSFGCRFLMKSMALVLLY
jgi:hypothetical protein